MEETIEGSCCPDCNAGTIKKEEPYGEWLNIYGCTICELKIRMK